MAIQAGVLPIFKKMIDHNKALMRKEIVWSLSNVMADSPEMVAECLSNGLI